MKLGGIALLIIVLAFSLGACRNTGGGGGGGTSSGGNPDNGKALFSSKGCPTCHTLKSVQGANGTIGPDLDGIGTRAGGAGHEGAKPPETPEQYIDESIKDPGAFVVSGFPPPNQGGMVLPVPVNDAERRDLVAFLLTQK
ncbi:MAG TPA: cytochrome c [Chloroflexota bacterium]|nr:cytochrome c [Chloroflexota bacterium]